jgi:LmbE family N-acetylglucosaminyl deacetylase
MAHGIVYAGGHVITVRRHLAPFTLRNRANLNGFPGFTPSDRVLVVAPHPDDESIATGGLLQVARAAGAACRVLLVTDGDNNPWPQRWQEKRWRIGPAERARWGARRRTEALAALQLLGVGPDEVCSLGLADLGLTDALMSGGPDVVALLLAQLDQFKPTRLIVPALEDRHPDHNALHVLFRLALLRYAGPAPQLYAFEVHGMVHPEGAVALSLSEAQRDAKRASILMHATQMLLSRKRFVAYAQAEEPFRLVPWLAAPSPHHPLVAQLDSQGDLRVRIDHAEWGGSMRGLSLFLVAQRGGGDSLRYRIAVGAGSVADVRDMQGDHAASPAEINRTNAETVVTVRSIGSLRAGWVKLGRPVPGLFVLDRVGWQTVSQPA